jgi:hypothetical protein
LASMKKLILGTLLCLFLSTYAGAADRPASPPGQSAIELPGTDVSVPWKHGKWVEVTYGRPLLRGRENIFGSGADYGKQVSSGSPVWRAGANQTTRLKTEVALMVGGKRIVPGSYDVFIELKESGWTLILSTQPAAEKYTPGDKTQMWGSYGYDPKFDVVRAPMTLTQTGTSAQQLTIDFVDVTASGSKLRVSWDKTIATTPFTIAR